MSMEKSEQYPELLAALDEILEGEQDPVLWMATTASLLRDKMGYLWIGFYRVQGEMLHVGPYQGELACLHIPFGKGVCGTCATRRETIIVPDVHDFPGHITCDSRARSEIVVPVVDSQGALRAVLDVDSAQVAAFDEVDAVFLEEIAERMADLQWDPEN